MKAFIFLAILVALSLVDAQRVRNALPWRQIQASKTVAVRANETKPADGHDLSDSDPEHLATWRTFKKKFARVYSGFEEELTRFKIFVENMIFINAHNKRFQKGEVSHSVGINEYADMSNSEFVAQRNGLRMDVKLPSKSKPSRLGGKLGGLLRTMGLPDSVDWRTQGYVTPVKQQGHCGSCWSFSATGAIEGQWFKKSGKLISLSEQQLVDCSQKWGNNGCNGGLMDNAFTYVNAVGGIEAESTYPYSAKGGTCNFNASAVVAHDTGFQDVTRGDESALQQAVATVGPVSVAIDASQMSFQLYKGGIYNEPSCSSTKLDHGVLAVGYGTDTQSGGDYWIVKNSWGTNWGEQGYVRMARNKNNLCGIATMASYPTE